MGSIELSKFLLVLGVVAEVPSVGSGLPSGHLFRIARCRKSNRTRRGIRLIKSLIEVPNYFEILDRSNMSNMATDT